MIIKFKIKDLPYLLKNIKIPKRYYKSVLVRNNHLYFGSFYGEKPLHTVTAHVLESIEQFLVPCFLFIAVFKNQQHAENLMISLCRWFILHGFLKITKSISTLQRFRIGYKKITKHKGVQNRHSPPGYLSAVYLLLFL